MDAGMMQQVESWIEQQFAGKQTMSKDELVQKSESSNLPTEARETLRELPQGSYTKDDLIGKARDAMMSKIGGGMGGMMGGQGGQGGGMPGM